MAATQQLHPAADDRGTSAEKPTDIPARGWKDIAIRTWKESSKDNVGIIAAGVAFYGFLALVPLLGATVLTYGLFASPETVLRHAGSITNMVPGEAGQGPGGGHGRRVLPLGGLPRGPAGLRREAPAGLPRRVTYRYATDA